MTAFLSSIILLMIGLHIRIEARLSRLETLINGRSKEKKHG